MEQLRKVVSVSCLTYILYGVISWWQLGAFLPPLPLKPFVFLIFFFFGSYHAYNRGASLLDYFFFSWLLIVSILDQSFTELILNEETVIDFQVLYEIYFLLLSQILFFTFNTIIIHNLSQRSKGFTLYYLVIILLTALVFIYPEYVFPEDPVIILSGLYFITERFLKNELTIKVQRVFVLLYGLSLIELIERIIWLY